MNGWLVRPLRSKSSLGTYSGTTLSPARVLPRSWASYEAISISVASRRRVFSGRAGLPACTVCRKSRNRVTSVRYERWVRGFRYCANPSQVCRAVSSSGSSETAGPTSPATQSDKGGVNSDAAVGRLASKMSFMGKAMDKAVGQVDFDRVGRMSTRTCRTQIQGASCVHFNCSVRQYVGANKIKFCSPFQCPVSNSVQRCSLSDHQLQHVAQRGSSSSDV